MFNLIRADMLPVVKFGEKLDRLIGSRSRAEIAALSGVPAQTITNYVTRGTEPSLTAAAKLARALNTDLDWLADDEREFPPPQMLGGKPLDQYDNESLMLEVAKRYRLELLDFLRRVNKAKSADLAGLKTQMDAWTPGKPLPDGALEAAMLHFLYLQIYGRWNVDFFAEERHDRLPGSDVDPATLSMTGIKAAFEELAGLGTFDALRSAVMQFVSKDQVADLLKVRHRTEPLKTP